MKEIKPSSNFVSLQRKRLYEEVADALKQAILKGDYQVGDKLPSELELADLFKVSRSVIREAIRFLELTGLVTIRQGARGGAFVSEISSQILQGYMSDLLRFGNVSVGQLFEIRTHVDPEVSRLAALRATEKDLQDLEQAIRLSKEGGPRDDVRHNTGFHRLLGRASHNLFYAVIEDCLAQLTLEFVETIKPSDEILHEDWEHDAILEAIRGRNPDRAFEVTQKHVEDISKKMMQYENAYLKKAKGE